jgi:hypothetical protein
LQLQDIAAKQQRDEPLPVVAVLDEPSSGIEDVLWHTTLSYHADLKAEAATKAAAELERMRTRAKKTVSADELAAVSAAASGHVTPPVSLHLLRPDELRGGMITQTAVAPQLADVFGELFQVRAGQSQILGLRVVQLRGLAVRVKGPRKQCQDWKGSSCRQKCFKHMISWRAANLHNRQQPTAHTHLSCCFPFRAHSQANGHELYLRDPRTTYGLPLGKPLLWKDIAEVARRQGDTAIGYTRMTHVTAGGSMQLGHGSEPHLGVVADSELTLLPGDKLVVVALD